MPDLLPYVDDVSLTSSMMVVVEDDVAVSTIELPVGGWVNWSLVGALNTPDLKGQS